MYEDIADLYYEAGNHEQAFQYYHDGHTDILYNDIAAGSNTMDNKDETIDYYNKSLSVCLDVLMRVLYIM